MLAYVENAHADPEPVQTPAPGRRIFESDTEIPSVDDIAFNTEPPSIDRRDAENATQHPKSRALRNRTSENSYVVVG